MEKTFKEYVIDAFHLGYSKKSKMNIYNKERVFEYRIIDAAYTEGLQTRLEKIVSKSEVQDKLNLFLLKNGL
jgi:hypothetical protein